MGKPFYTVYDIETTGLSAACQCEIIEFAGIQYDENLNELNRLHIYVKPYTKLPKKIVELTGITNEQLAGCENRFKALPKIRNFIGDTISVCHNASFDFGFISTMCVQQGLPVLTDYICTLKSYKALTGEKQAKLFMVCDRLGISLENAHTAICDAEATAKLFKKLMELNEQEPVSKLYRKSYSEDELYKSVMANIAAQNPNKKVREAVTQYVEGSKKIDVNCVFNLFEKAQDPIKVANTCGYDSNEVAKLFTLWLNQTRCPRFVFLEDFTLNRQIEAMIRHSGSLNDLYELHAYIYKDKPINKGLYSYFWIKHKHSDFDEYHKMLNFLFELEVDPCELITILPHIYPSDIVLAFCKFAEGNKNNKREYIAKTIVSRLSLNEAINSDALHYTNDELIEHPDKINLAITCALYERNFFKIAQCLNDDLMNII